MKRRKKIRKGKNVLLETKTKIKIAYTWSSFILQHMSMSRQSLLMIVIFNDSMTLTKTRLKKGCTKIYDFYGHELKGKICEIIGRKI